MWVERLICPLDVKKCLTFASKGTSGRDSKMDKVVTGLGSYPVTAHGNNNIIVFKGLKIYTVDINGCGSILEE